MQVSVQFTMKLPVKITRRDKWYLASCPIIDVHSQGNTEEEAKKNLSEALSLFFISCFERGTLAAVLKECGFQPVHHPPGYKPRPAAAVSEEDSIDVPIPFLVNYTDQTQCHA